MCAFTQVPSSLAISRSSCCLCSRHALCTALAGAATRHGSTRATRHVRTLELSSAHTPQRLPLANGPVRSRTRRHLLCQPARARSTPSVCCDRSMQKPFQDRLHHPFLSLSRTVTSHLVGGAQRAAFLVAVVDAARTQAARTHTHPHHHHPVSAASTTDKRLRATARDPDTTAPRPALASTPALGVPLHSTTANSHHPHHHWRLPATNANANATNRRPLSIVLCQPPCAHVLNRIAQAYLTCFWCFERQRQQLAAAREVTVTMSTKQTPAHAAASSFGCTLLLASVSMHC